MMTLVILLILILIFWIVDITPKNVVVMSKNVNVILTIAGVHEKFDVFGVVSEGGLHIKKLIKTKPRQVNKLKPKIKQVI